MITAEKVAAIHLVTEELVAGDSRLALCERARLVKDNVSDFVGPLQGICPLDENSVGCGHTCAHHHSCGSGQPQGTGAGNDQNGYAKQHGKEEMIVALRAPAVWVELHDPSNVPSLAENSGAIMSPLLGRQYSRRFPLKTHGQNE